MDLLKKQKVVELKKLAKSLNIKKFSTMKKEELVNIIFSKQSCTTSGETTEERTIEERTIEERTEELPKLILAHNYEEDINVEGWFVSEKLDGIRAYWDGNKLYTRGGKELFAPQSFLDKLPKELTLDGELTAGRGHFDQTCSITKRHIPNVNDWMKMITYSVFDILSVKGEDIRQLTFKERLDILKDYPQISVLKQEIIKDNKEVMIRLNNVVKLGGEGLMLRHPESYYEGKRSKNLLKVKKFLDCEGKIISYKPGTNKYLGMMGALECELSSGVRVYVGSGYTDQMRKNPPPIGAFITIKFFELSKKGVPRFPIFLRIAERQSF